MFIDTHFHLTKDDYDDVDKVVLDAIENEVSPLVISGCDKMGIIEGLDYIKKYDNLYMTVGFHPEYCEEINDEDIIWLEKIIRDNKKIVGIGEIGLDYYYTKDNKEKQIFLFKKQLSLAEKLSMPVVIHSREAFLDTYQLLSNFKGAGVIHCFTSNIENANKYIKLGFKLGIGGVLTFKNSNLKEVIRKIDLKSVVLETDSPYLSPEPFRGKKNTPSNVVLVAERIAEIKNLSLKEVGRITTLNASELFDLK